MAFWKARTLLGGIYVSFLENGDEIMVKFLEGITGEFLLEKTLKE
ncbi:hypothetical protein [Anaplasma phagocytophilum]|nr:hypothetical protein [Anaplasma phagocytophilum]